MFLLTTLKLRTDIKSNIYLLILFLYLLKSKFLITRNKDIVIRNKVVIDISISYWYFLRLPKLQKVITIEINK